ncbi:hypothetical protein ANN_22602 [Periplaneta americana]|uniref:Uncharacterized protein n=1 Tax=Periplaneta americana TaxID=6978 RepID=A0ABQ8S9F8_PERAM|nr:hypothetical protein ANN_22602 [Periplaneta americana]
MSVNAEFITGVDEENSSGQFTRRVDDEISSRQFITRVHHESSLRGFTRRGRRQYLRESSSRQIIRRVHHEERSRTVPLREELVAGRRDFIEERSSRQFIKPVHYGKSGYNTGVGEQSAGRFRRLVFLQWTWSPEISTRGERAMSVPAHIGVRVFLSTRKHRFVYTRVIRQPRTGTDWCIRSEWNPLGVNRYVGRNVANCDWESQCLRMVYRLRGIGTARSSYPPNVIHLCHESFMDCQRYVGNMLPGSGPLLKPQWNISAPSQLKLRDCIYQTEVLLDRGEWSRGRNVNYRDASLMLAGSEFQSLGRAIVKEDEYEKVRWDGISAPDIPRLSQMMSPAEALGQIFPHYGEEIEDLSGTGPLRRFTP